MKGIRNSIQYTATGVPFAFTTVGGGAGAAAGAATAGGDSPATLNELRFVTIILASMAWFSASSLASSASSCAVFERSSCAAIAADRDALLRLGGAA